MAAKFILLSLLVASVYGSGGYSSFSYGVSDPQTGDVKDQHEKRVGNSVVGKYSLLESDGTKRIVEYAANDATGFKAVVRKEPAVGIHPSGPHNPTAIGPHGHGQVAHPAQLAQGPVAPGLGHPAPFAPAASPSAHRAPLVPLAGAIPHVNVGALAHPGALGNAGALAHSNALGHAGALVHPGAIAHPGAHVTHAGALPHPNALGYGGALAHPGALPQPGALASHSGVYSHPSALTHSNALTHSGAFSPLASPHPGNQAYYGHAPFAGANGYVNPLAGHLGARGAPTVSHYSHSIVHDPARPYAGPYAGNNYGAYGGAYGGWSPAPSHGAYGASLAQWSPNGANGALAYGLNNHVAHGRAHSYVNSVSHPSPLNHGAYGAQGLGAGLTW